MFLFQNSGSQGDTNKLCPDQTNELVLDAGFVVPKDVSNNGRVISELVSNNEFIAPEINSFGQSFRSLFIHF